MHNSDHWVSSQLHEVEAVAQLILVINYKFEVNTIFFAVARRTLCAKIYISTIQNHISTNSQFKNNFYFYHHFRERARATERSKETWRISIINWSLDIICIPVTCVYFELNQVSLLFLWFFSVQIWITMWWNYWMSFTNWRNHVNVMCTGAPIRRNCWSRTRNFPISKSIYLELFGTIRIVFIDIIHYQFLVSFTTSFWDFYSFRIRSKSSQNT